ncbi:MAG: hypothetical protein HY548_08500, partial [Elusimicrobia bacterium]|nr:hypothetical protein [Elusimicrobiota bacterium]
LKAALEGFNNQLQENPEAAGKAFGEFTSDVLAVVGASFRAGGMNALQVQGVGRYLLALRERLSGETSTQSHSASLITLLANVLRSAVVVTEETVKANQAERGDAIGVHLQEVTEKMSEAQLRTLAREIALRIAHNEQIMFVTSAPAGRVAGQLRALEAWTAKELGDREAPEGWRGFASRVISQEGHAIIAGNGRFSPDAIYDVLGATWLKDKGKFYMYVAMLDMNHWNRSVRPEIAAFVKFLVDIMGKTIQMTPLQEKEMQAIELLSIQA